jgi:hypothetical protein
MANYKVILLDTLCSAEKLRLKYESDKKTIIGKYNNIGFFYYRSIYNGQISAIYEFL